MNFGIAFAFAVSKRAKLYLQKQGLLGEIFKATSDNVKEASDALDSNFSDLSVHNCRRMSSHTSFQIVSAQS